MMKEPKKYLGAGVFAAFAASLCCIGPLFALLAGIGGAASIFSWVEPLRPYLIGVSILALGLAWFSQLKPEKDIECDCEEDSKKNFLNGKMFLSILTVLSVLFMFLPAYINGLNNTANTKSLQSENFTSAELKVSGMTCEGCETNIKNYSLSAGAESVKSDFKTGEVSLKYDKHKTNLDSIKKSIELLGYKVISESERKN